MLRSWTRRLGLENDLSVGIALSSSNVCVVKVNWQDGKPNITWIKQGTIERPLFESEDLHDNGDALYKALWPIVESLEDKSLPVHVVMPDTVIRTATFELDELPKSRKTLSSLARWRMSDELGRGEDELVCQTMSLGDDDGKHLLYVQAGDRYWLEHVKSSFNACRILPWSINSASHSRYNYLNTQGIKPVSAMLSIDDNCWTLQVWDSDTRIRLTLTRLRRAHTSTRDEEMILNELTRVLRAWQVNHPDYTFNTLYLDGRKECIDRLIGQPSGLFKDNITMKLDRVKPVNEMNTESPLMALATMAAVTE